ILVLADVEEDEFWIEDASIATAAIQVAAEGAGVASCRVQIRNRKDKNGNDLSDLLQHMMLFPLKVEPVFMIFLFDSSEYHTNLISRLNKIHYERW
ncbi:MAG: hypothetical protein Q4D17_11900, partial [Planctomycetia bacterium]|nr:hypothetical protein [Planctomycetia bacterium]